MNFLSICSGIEAASVASAPLGWKAVGLSEIEPFPCAVLKHHYPDVPNYGDMMKFEEWPEMDVDLLCGGTPCQAFSVAGKRRGLDDDRGNLTLVFCRIADRYQPDWIMWENVPGVLSSKDNAFGCFLAELCGADAPIQPVGGRWPNAGVVAGPKRTAAWRVLDAQYVRVDGYPYAVPQRRRRVFVVACPGNTGDPATVLFEPESVCRNTPPRRETGQGTSEDVAKCIRGCSGGIDREDMHTIIPVSAPILSRPYADRGASDEGNLVVGHRMVAFGEYESDETASAMKARDFKDATDLVSCICYENHAQDSRIKDHGNLSPTLPAKGGTGGTGGNNLPLVMQPSIAFSCKDNLRDAVSEIAPTLRSMNGERANGGGQLAVAHTLRGEGFDASEDGTGRGVPLVSSFQQNQLGEIREGDIAGTLNTNSNPSGRNTPMIKHSMQVRRLTPIECERLQGFPDNYTRIPWRNKSAKQCPDGPRYKALGNSWAVNCARWIFMRIELVSREGSDHEQ